MSTSSMNTLGLATLLILINAKKAKESSTTDYSCEPETSESSKRQVSDDFPVANCAQKGVMAATSVQQLYEVKIAVETSKLVGQNPNAKGVTHELMHRDQLNFKPKNILEGNTAKLAKSRNAVRDDILVFNKSGHIIRREQLKDTPKSIYNTTLRVKNKDYVRTNLMGSVETTNGYNIKASRHGIKQKMTSTGISSRDTERIADKALGKMTSLSNLAHSAKSSFKVGSRIGAGIELIRSFAEFIEGKISAGRMAVNVIKEGVLGGLTGMSVTVTSSIAAAGTAIALSSLGVSAPVWVPLAVGVGAAVIVGSIVRSFFGGLFSIIFGVQCIT